MKRLLPLTALLFTSCAATRPLGEAIATTSTRITDVSGKPFWKVVEKDPPFHPVVKYPLAAATWPLAFAGAAVGAIVMVPGLILSPSQY